MRHKNDVGMHYYKYLSLTRACYNIEERAIISSKPLMFCQRKGRYFSDQINLKCQLVGLIFQNVKIFRAFS